MREIVIVRGAGDIATGVIQKFYRSGIKVLSVETEKPTAIRRTVSLSDALYNGMHTVEDMTSKKVNNLAEITKAFDDGFIPVLVDPDLNILKELKALALIDAIIAKKNLGTNKNLADITIALGPGFNASVDVDIVVETSRGHDLGRLIFNGFAKENTGIPGEIKGYSKERVIHMPKSAYLKHNKNIGDVLEAGEIIFYADDLEVKSTFKGLIRGMIQDGYYKEGMKVADIDPRTDVDFNTISDKARTIGGAALEAYLYMKKELEK